LPGGFVELNLSIDFGNKTSQALSLFLLGCSHRNFHHSISFGSRFLASACDEFLSLLLRA
jgi:hypothetical protein